MRIIEEKMMGRSRADVIMVTEDALVGIEIKSDADSYVRLARQVRDYERFYDYNYVVVGTSHAMHIEEHVPDAWGIITVERADAGQPHALDFYILRRASANPHVDMAHKIRILWRPELARIQMRNRMPEYRRMSKQFVRDRIAERVPADVLNRQISEELFERDYTTIGEELAQYREQTHRKRRRRRKSF